MLSRLSHGTRGVAAVVLIVLGAVLLFTGTIAFYAREQVIDREAFADRALEALDTNRIFFVRGKENALFDLGDAAQVVQFALRSVSPKVAKELPQDLKPQLLTLQRREFAGATLSAADAVRPLGIMLPLLALLTFAAAVVLSPDRRIGVLRIGIATG